MTIIVFIWRPELVFIVAWFYAHFTVCWTLTFSGFIAWLRMAVKKKIVKIFKTCFRF